jgi:thiamine phosphate synthase YjbQ (UPF0047 family)
MKSHTKYLTFHTPLRRQLLRITDEVAAVCRDSGIQEGMILVSAMHITAGVFINDDEPGLHADIERWVQKLAPGPAADWPGPAASGPEALFAGGKTPPQGARPNSKDSAAGPDYQHHRTGEDNGDAHLKNLLIGHQVIVPVTAGKLDLGPWQQIFYFEFDGRRNKRLVIKALGA